MEQNQASSCSCVCRCAVAHVMGGSAHPGIRGTIRFEQQRNGVLVTADVRGLPTSEFNVFAFHIHEGNRCEGDFSSAGGHFNPTGTAHPGHAGDLPPLFSNGGTARMTVVTDRFRVCDIIGRTVIIHAQPDDFHSQPAGNAGSRIACGVIKKV